MAESMGPGTDWLQLLLASWLDVALALCLGLIVLRGALAPATVTRLPHLTRHIAWLLGLGLAGDLLVATQAMTEAGLAGLPAALWLVLNQTTFGITAWIALAAWGLLILGTTRRGPARLQLLGAIALAYAVAAIGHVADHGLLSRAALVNTVHVLSAGAWAGSVALCVLFLRDWPAWSPPERSALARRLSRVATFAVPLVIATGIANGVRMLAHATDPIGSLYFKLLAGKVALVGLAVLLGLWNRWVWMRQLDRGEANGARAFARVLATEAVLLILVLGLAATLGTTMPPE